MSTTPFLFLYYSHSSSSALDSGFYTVRTASAPEQKRFSGRTSDFSTQQLLGFTSSYDFPSLYPSADNVPWLEIVLLNSRRRNI